MKSIISVLFVLACLIVYSSCYNRGMCVVSKADIITDIRVGKQKLKTEIWNSIDSANNNRHVFASNQTNVSLIPLLDFADPNIYSSIVKQKDEIASIIYYLNTHLAAHSIIDKKDIIGVGVYHYEGQRLMYHFYKKEGNAFILKPKQTAKKDNVTTNDIFAIAKTYFSNEEELCSYNIINKQLLFHHNEK